MSEGGLNAPIRHPIDWENPDFTDEQKLDAEMRRVFDICHGCRRCFNLCDSFPRLFDLIDESKSGELDEVDSKDFAPVVEACTLCDMCFMTKCPYVPPHAFNLDFPHLMVRARAVELKKGEIGLMERQLTETDRNGKIAGAIAPLSNWASERGNSLTRPIMEAVTGIDRNVELPKFHGRTFTMRAKSEIPEVNAAAPAKGRKAVIFATCFANYNNPDIGMAARKVLAKNGVETEVAYPGCCGMPQLEHGDLARVADSAVKIAADLCQWIDKGYDVIALVPSCALMLKFEWPLIVPKNRPGYANVEKLSKRTFDCSQYIVDISKKEGIAPGLKPLEGGVALHLACHARAQNVGQQAAELLRLIPGMREDLAVMERCSGHGGSWGVLKKNFQTAIKVGRPVANQAVAASKAYIASECPLAGKHIRQGMGMVEGGKEPAESLHPIQLFAKAYGL
jgi:glycerol-3-phosphate dehydrogenase subunit C